MMARTQSMSAATGQPEAAETRGPLSGVRVVDLTAVFLGPYCTQVLGDMGADVIKVESPDGDIVRGIGPARHHGMGPIHLSVNRSKRSLVLDLREPAGRAALLKIAAGADVFVHSMRPQAIARLGLTYGEVSAARPDIVYCAAYGFGEDGPYAGKPAYDDMVQGASGIAAVQGQMHGEPEYVTTVIADKTTGLSAAYAIVMALYHRQRTGEGQAIEVPMFETMVSYLLVEQLYGMTFEPTVGSAMYPRATSRYRRPYPTADGHICVVVYTDKHWEKLFELAGRPELVDDDRFRTISGRTQHIDELYKLVGEVIERRTTREWLQAFEEADIPAMALNSPEDLLDDPHLVERGFIRTLAHPTEGAIRTVGIPVKFSRTPGGIDRLAPTLGQHSGEVLAEAGYSDSDIDALVEAGVTIRPQAAGAGA
jgi:crotonobetainyl-CoA:carnitine CoA-transferase CaiB-like acyl-CoA transferase